MASLCGEDKPIKQFYPRTLLKFNFSLSYMFKKREKKNENFEKENVCGGQKVGLDNLPSHVGCPLDIKSFLR